MYVCVCVCETVRYHAVMSAHPAHPNHGVAQAASGQHQTGPAIQVRITVSECVYNTPLQARARACGIGKRD